MTGLYEATDQLRVFPKMGHPAPGFENDELRELVHREYRIVYEISGDAVTLVAIFHGSMDVESRLRALLDQ
jgi:plasmid stabilization system protein ParE